jgi:hypothetical protein
MTLHQPFSRTVSKAYTEMEILYNQRSNFSLFLVRACFAITLLAKHIPLLKSSFRKDAKGFRSLPKESPRSQLRLQSLLLPLQSKSRRNR